MATNVCERRRAFLGRRTGRRSAADEHRPWIGTHATARRHADGSAGATAWPGCRGWCWCRTSCGSCSSGWCRKLRRGLRAVAGVGVVTGKCRRRLRSWPRRAARGSSCRLRRPGRRERRPTGVSPSGRRSECGPALPLGPRRARESRRGEYARQSGPDPAGERHTADPLPLGRRRRRRRKPGKLHGDKGYDYSHLRRCLRRRGTTHRIARKGVESSQRLGLRRWTIERTMRRLVLEDVHVVGAYRPSHLWSMTQPAAQMYARPRLSPTFTYQMRWPLCGYSGTAVEYAHSCRVPATAGG